jgi:periplasmic protein TonB
MIALVAEDLADLRRWAICGAIVVFAHGGLAAGMVTWHEEARSAGPSAAIVVDFAPVPVARTTPEAEVPPGPPQEASEASPSKPVETLEENEKIEQKVEAKLEQKVEEKVEAKPVEEPPPEVAPAPNPEVAIEPPPPQEVKQETARRQNPSLASTASAPHVIADETAAIPAAPEQSDLSPIDSQGVKMWNEQIAALLTRKLRYPPKAMARGEHGVVKIFFILDRNGRVIDSNILRSSGVAALDEEALALVNRVQPFPPPPADVLGERIERTAPIRFLLKQR